MYMGMMFMKPSTKIVQFMVRVSGPRTELIRRYIGNVFNLIKFILYFHSSGIEIEYIIMIHVFWVGGSGPLVGATWP